MTAASLELLHEHKIKDLPLRRKQTQADRMTLTLCLHHFTQDAGRLVPGQSIDLEADSLGASSCDYPVPENPVGLNHLASDPTSWLTECNPSPLASFSTYLIISFPVLRSSPV